MFADSGFPNISRFYLTCPFLNAYRGFSLVSCQSSPKGTAMGFYRPNVFSSIESTLLKPKTISK